MVHAFVSEWNGVALLQGVELEKERGKVEVWTDASGSWGCGWPVVQGVLLHGPCYCLGNSSIKYRRVCLAINAVGAAQIIKSVCVAGSSLFVFLFLFFLLGVMFSVNDVG